MHLEALGNNMSSIHTFNSQLQQISNTVHFPQMQMLDEAAAVTHQVQP
jgi:hypothetical protein